MRTGTPDHDFMDELIEFVSTKPGLPQFSGDVAWLKRSDGSAVDVALLRSPEWIADYGAHVGGTVWLNMPEMGVEA